MHKARLSPNWSCISTWKKTNWWFSVLWRT